MLEASASTIAVRHGSMSRRLSPPAPRYRPVLPYCHRYLIGPHPDRVLPCPPNRRRGLAAGGAGLEVDVGVVRATVGVIVLGLVANGTGWAQAVAGAQLSGVVRDASGATIPGAEVTVTKTDTGAARTTFTGADGAYAFPNLPVGPYQLKVVLQ